MNNPLRVLILEDQQSDAELMALALKRSGLEFDWRRVETEAEYAREIEANPDVILADYNLPQFDAERALNYLQKRGLDIPLIVVTGNTSEEVAVERMKQGAADYLLKDRLARLGPVVVNAVEQKKVRDERKRAVETLHETEARQAAILEAALDGIVTTDQGGKIIDINPAAEKLFGLHRLETLGKNIAELIIRPSPRNTHRAGLPRCLTIGEESIIGKRIEMTALRVDGTEFPIELTFVPVRPAGSLIFTSFIRDISEQKKQAQLRLKNRELEEQNRRIQEANRLKSEFLANMSHELRTPLNAIIGFAELIHDGKAGPLAGQQQEFLGDILTSAKHLLQLINDILDLSKIEAGKMDFHPEPVNLQMAVEEVLAIVRSLAATKRIGLKSEIDPSLTGIVADLKSLKQILYNYVSNALKFTPEDGQVVIRVQNEKSNRFRIEVKDNGIGIKAEDIGQLFSEFHQLDSGAAKKYSGTGLGLALTKKIVEAQGGEVGVTSAPGKGSLFYAVLPRVARQAVAPANRQFSLPAMPGAPSILVIEDEAEDRAWLTRQLSEAGYNVEAAATGSQALARCREKRFDAITLDFMLPDMTGRDVLRRLREEDLNRDTPVIVMTVLAQDGLVAGFQVNEILAKPTPARELLAALERSGIAPKSCRPILVVDDDEPAAKLTQATLALNGYKSVRIADVASARRAAPREKPAAILLDLAVPQIDTVEFLRRFKNIAGSRRSPVILWTEKEVAADERYRRRAAGSAFMPQSGSASALMEELQRCLAKPGQKKL